ncbi:hypothetical protein [Amaricoccus sp.]|uniref:hypothetical protein n=1 Tax=Amaricoccus sp. TaxID=1872485 RepID=UPI001B47F131|nr:hypothetical protein [Amaricoccus sp.]MBP7003001.1 hypothetical protein [Amaricoccus sp.]
MTHYTVTLRLAPAIAGAVAVEWTNAAAPVDSGRGWEPCLRLDDGAWRFSSVDPAAAEAAHRRRPGPFADLAIRYRLEPAGPWSAAADPRKDIVIVPDEGDVEALLPPLALTAPSLLGAGLVGTELTLDPGTWGGFPLPVLAFQWRRDGVDVAGATARAYAVGVADDGCALACAVTATSAAGAATATAGPVAVRRAAPRRVAELPEEVFDEGTGVQRVETAFAFAGEALAFSAEGAAIDTKTGALSLPTDRPVGGATVTVAAANSGGRAEARLAYTVEAAPPRPLAAADVTVLRSVWRPEGQTKTFSPELAFPGLASETPQAIEFTADPLGAAAPVWRPVRAKAGAAGTWMLVDDKATATADLALFEAGDARRSRIRLRWRTAETRPFSEPGAVLEAPVPAAAAPLAPTPAMLAEAMGSGALVYDETVNTGVNRPRTAHTVPVVALGALANVAFAAGGKTPATYLRDQLVTWGSGVPAAEGGVRGQREFHFLATAAIAKRTPAVWNALTPLLRRKIDRAVEGLLVSYCWQMSDQNPNVKAGRNEVTIRGEANWARGFNPNFTLPAILGPSIAAAYMGGPAAATAFLDGFDRDAFAAAIAADNVTPAGSLTGLWNTFRQTWPGGPTGAELKAAVRNYRLFGMSLDQTSAIAGYALTQRMWTKVIKVGLTLKANSKVPGGFPAPTPGAIGIFEPAAKLNAAGSVGRGAFVGRITNQAAWAGLPNAGLPGMAHELDSNDGGLNGSGGGPRSSVSYAHEGAVLATVGVATLAVCGMLDRSDAALQEGLARQTRGITDLRYRNTHGHRDFSKGGWPWVGAGNDGNGDWDTEGRVAAWRYGLAYDLHEKIVLPWSRG